MATSTPTLRCCMVKPALRLTEHQASVGRQRPGPPAGFNEKSVHVARRSHDNCQSRFHRYGYVRRHQAGRKPGTVCSRHSFSFALRVAARWFRAAAPGNAIGLRRRRTLGSSFVEQIELTNHGLEAVEVDLSLAIDVDFADIFEVRGFLAEEPPERAAGHVEAGQVVFANCSLEHPRQTQISFSCTPGNIDPHLVTFAVGLEANASWSIDVTVEWVIPRSETTLPIPIHSIHEEQSIANWLREAPVLESSDFYLQKAFERSIHDLVTLELVLSSGHAIPAAGVPWYLAIFGRDAIITSLQTLPIAPRYAIGTLRTLAAYQATASDAFRDAEPGKMPHEIRFGSLAQSDAV